MQNGDNKVWDGAGARCEMGQAAVLWAAGEVREGVAMELCERERETEGQRVITFVLLTSTLATSSMRVLSLATHVTSLVDS